MFKVLALVPGGSETEWVEEAHPRDEGEVPLQNSFRKLAIKEGEIHERD